MLEPRKRTALDGKSWWCVFDTEAGKYSTLTCFGKYEKKKDCQYAISKYKNTDKVDMLKKMGCEATIKFYNDKNGMEVIAPSDLGYNGWCVGNGQFTYYDVNFDFVLNVLGKIK